MKGLMVREEWLNKILSGEKIWEIRGKNIQVRGRIALIQSGSGLVVGKCELADVVGPLSLREFRKNAHLAGVEPEIIRGMPYDKTYAWVLKNAQRLSKPVPYTHPYGAVIWVNLDFEV